MRFFSLLTMLAFLSGCPKDESADPPITCSDEYATAYDCDCDGVTNAADPVSGCAAVPDTDPQDTDTDTDVDMVDEDGDGVAVEDGDCDDGNASVNPGASESCNDRDDNCDGVVDEGAGSTWYADADQDGYGDAAWSEIACTAPERFVANASDCDDLDAAVSPAATELCNEVDDDCDGVVDNNPTDGDLFYRDADGDGWGTEVPDDMSDIEWACEAPAGFVALNGDCNDASSAYHPSAPETDCADPADYNCDGFTGAVDGDVDGYYACEECDDGDAAINPGAAEMCDRVDNDCDGRVDTTDAVDARTWYPDADNDMFGDMTGSPYLACTQPGGRVEDATDCDDRDPAVNPDADEVCDALDADEDCDGAADDADASVTGVLVWYQDIDLDAYGNPAVSMEQCEQPAGYVANDGDCDDLDNSEPTVDACE